MGLLCFSKKRLGGKSYKKTSEPATNFLNYCNSLATLTGRFRLTAFVECTAVPQQLFPPQINLPTESDIDIQLPLEHTPPCPGLNAEGDQRCRLHNGLGDGLDDGWLI